jgi:hypothetical protein
VNDVEKQISDKYEKNMRQNEKNLLTIQKRRTELEEQEDMLFNLKTQSIRYIDEQREIFFGTNEFARFHELENNLYDITEMSRKQLDKERDDLEREETRLYKQEEVYYEEYQSALRKLYYKEDA